MGLYESIKDVASIAQKADNIDLYKKLLDISGQALDIQNELSEACREIERLKNNLAMKRSVVRHSDGLYITIEGEDDIHYCSTCWGNSSKLIQLTGDDRCIVCETKWREAHK